MALSFTVDSIGTGTGQQVDGAYTSVILFGALNGCSINLEVSTNDTDYVPALGDRITPGMLNITIPVGWYIRIVTAGGAAPDATVVVA